MPSFTATGTGSGEEVLMGVVAILVMWFVALGTRVLPRFFKLLPWVDLDLFYAKVKLVT